MSTEDTANLKSSNFRVAIENLASVTYNIQQASIPGFNMGTVDQFAQQEADYVIGGEKLVYNPWSMTFIVDEKLTNFKAIKSWMERVVSTDSGAINEASDISLVIYDSRNQPSVEVHMKNALPISMSDIVMDIVNEEVTMICTATFEYDLYDII